LNVKPVAWLEELSIELFMLFDIHQYNIKQKKSPQGVKCGQINCILKLKIKYGTQAVYNVLV